MKNNIDIRQYLIDIIDKEVDYGKSVYGEFNTPHEFYGVLLEEIQEFMEASSLVMTAEKKIFTFIRNDMNIKLSIEKLENETYQTIEELIQILAICKKWKTRSKKNV